MRYFCIAHRPLEWAVPGFMEPVSTVPAGEGVTDLAERYPELAGRGPELSEYATLFAVRRLLQESWGGDEPPADERMLGIGHYRRFAVTRETGTRSDLYGVVPPERFLELPDELFLPQPGELLIPQPVRFPVSVLSQYGQAHVLRDLLHFMGIAIDLGVVDGAAVGRFLGDDVFIAAPTVGVWPALWTVLVLEALETVVTEFDKSVGVARDGYQQRALGFCCERLHALLALQLVSSWPQEKVIGNRLLVVSEEGGYRIGG